MAAAPSGGARDAAGGRSAAGEGAAGGLRPRAMPGWLERLAAVVLRLPPVVLLDLLYRWDVQAFADSGRPLAGRLQLRSGRLWSLYYAGEDAERAPPGEPAGRTFSRRRGRGGRGTPPPMGRRRGRGQLQAGLQAGLEG